MWTVARVMMTVLRIQMANLPLIAAATTRTMRDYLVRPNQIRIRTVKMKTRFRIHLFITKNWKIIRRIKLLERVLF